MMPDSPVYVLVVEDDFLNRLHAVNLVEDAGYIAVEASNADEAITILEARKDIRIVFTDIDMPGSMDGLKLAHAIRERWPPIELFSLRGTLILVTMKSLSAADFFRNHIVIKRSFRPYSILSLRSDNGIRFLTPPPVSERESLVPQNETPPLSRGRRVLKPELS